jgi:hypothetical protein
MASWSFLTNHARALLCIAPGMRLRDIAASPVITERSAHGTVSDLAEAGYVVKQKDGFPRRADLRGRRSAAACGQSWPGSRARRRAATTAAWLALVMRIPS